MKPPMLRINTLTTLKFLTFSILLVLVSVSPSLNIIPQKLIPTSLHDSQRLLELLLISLVLLYSSTLRTHASGFPANRKIHYALYLLIALAVTSSCLAMHPRHALIEISILSGLFFLSLYIARLYHENNTLFIKWLTYAIWVGISLSMAAFYVGYITATIFKTPVIWPAPITGFNNIRFFNQYQLWTLGLITLPLLSFDLKGKYTRYWLHIGLACWWVLLFHSTSRGVLLAWLAGILVTMAIYRKSAWPFIRLQLMHITAGFISYKILFELTPNLRGTILVTGTVIRDTIGDRIELWNQSIRLFLEHPVLGIGPMHFAWYNHTSSSAHPHNSVLQALTEWGLPATLIMVAIAGYGVFCWLKRFNPASLQTETKLNSGLAIALFFTLVTNAAYSLVDGVIVMPVSQVMMFTFIGLMLGFYNKERLNHVERKNVFSPLLAGIILIALVCSALPEILQSANGNEKEFSMGYTALGPRIWLEFK